MIFDERVMAIYQYGHDGSVQQTHCSAFEDESPSVNDTTSARSLIWTAYSKAICFKTGDVTDDAIYVAREDGLIQFITCRKNRDSVQPRMGDAAKVSVGIDTAFAALKLDLLTTKGLSSRDYLLVGGSGGNGAIYEVRNTGNGVYECS